MLKKPQTIGFGAPQTFGAHVFEVRLPQDKSKVSILEYFGLKSDGADDHREQRIELTYATWCGIREAARTEFNRLLKAKKLPPGRWDLGTTKLDRLLGKELCVLAWAVLDASNSEIPHICAKWASLSPEERWWLYGMASAEGNSAHKTNGWQRALSVALSGGPMPQKTPQKTTSEPKGPRKNGHPQFNFSRE